jgi:DNA-directed RNA polymerase specialized sigma24 family protein
VDRSEALELLPEAYAHALRLRDARVEPAEIARRLGIAPEALTAALELAEAKLARLLADALITRRTEPGEPDSGSSVAAERKDPYSSTDDT